MEVGMKQDIVYALRKKGVAEAEIPRFLTEAKEKSLAGGDNFSVADFVAGVPRGTNLSKGTKIGRIAAGFVILCIGAQLFVGGVFGVRPGFPGILFYYGAVFLGLCVLVFSAYRIDRRLPVE